jgi:oligoendopeptidase F
VGGKELPLPQLAPFLKEPDRDVRERAFRASTAPYVNARAELSRLFDRMYGLRQQVARNAGFRSFRDYVFKGKAALRLLAGRLRSASTTRWNST